jgi:nucleoside-diphosphate-sugar epimerase
LSGTVLITGATGQVGHAIARRLTGDGVEPRALVRSPERARALPEGVLPVFGDVTDPASLEAALDGCATVYHSAGIPEQWRRDTGEFARVNLEGTRNVVEAALAAGVERFVYTSTDDVLVQGPGQAYDESKLNPSSGATPYQRSKIEADRVVTAALDRGLPAVFLHPAGLYGPSPFLAKGLNDLLMELAKRKTPMLLPGGMGVAYSDDVADGHVRAAAQAPVGARYILAESFQSLTDIARAVAASEPRAKVPRVMPMAVARGVSVVGERVARRTGRPPLISRSVLLFLERGSRPSGARARAELGWEPTPFASGVDRTLAHFRRQGWL